MKNVNSILISKQFLLLLLLLCAGAISRTEAQSVNPADSSQIIADKIIQSKIPVLIDFWAVWCGPCKILNPMISKLEKKYKGKVLFLKVNVDIHKAISQYFQVQAIPSVFIVNNKDVVKYLQGLQPEEAYIAAIEEVLELVKNEKAADTEKQ